MGIFLQVVEATTWRTSTLWNCCPFFVNFPCHPSSKVLNCIRGTSKNQQGWHYSSKKGLCPSSFHYPIFGALIKSKWSVLWCSRRRGLEDVFCFLFLKPFSLICVWFIQHWSSGLVLVKFFLNWSFLLHSPQDLLRNSNWLFLRSTPAAMVHCKALLMQPDHIQNFFFFLPSDCHDRTNKTENYTEFFTDLKACVSKPLISCKTAHLGLFSIHCMHNSFASQPLLSHFHSQFMNKLNNS